ncbi:hypothetical protein JMJ76_0000020 [Colletotrichum scovillei]|nr:hypothetical protein JMJ76_0000020 [Colletotrichum scovillei]
MRCRREAELTSTDDLEDAGLVEIGENLYYCFTCAKLTNQQTFHLHAASKPVRQNKRGSPVLDMERIHWGFCAILAAGVLLFGYGADSCVTIQPWPCTLIGSHLQRKNAGRSSFTGWFPPSTLQTLQKALAPLHRPDSRLSLVLGPGRRPSAPLSSSGHTWCRIGFVVSSEKDRRCLN